MAVIINLKELFASDAQEMYVDKVNFNFNKLLELGIGQPGPQGITGPLGSAGPVGIQGVPGQRGNKWYTGVGTPVGQTFPGLIVNDFYLDIDASSIYQYQGSPASWIQITDFTNIVNSIITGSGTPFVRGFGETSPDDQRYITFTRHGNDQVDQTLDISLGNASNNDILLLNNWNEKHITGGIDNFPTNTNTEFNSMQHISVDHSAGTATGRYHLEFGSLYKSAGNLTKLSGLNNNLKIRYKKEVNIPTFYPASNETINTAMLSLGLPEANVTSILDTNQQGLFLLDTPLYNIEDPDPQNQAKGKLNIRIGTTEPIKETSQILNPVDGIEFHIKDDGQGNFKSSVAIGLLREENYPDWTLPFGIDKTLYSITKSPSVKATVIEGDTYSYNGSLNYMHTESKVNENMGLSSLGSGYAPSSVQGWQGITKNGNYLFAVSPKAKTQQSYSERGAMKIWDISNPDEPILIDSSSNNSDYSAGQGANIDWDLHGNPAGNGGFLGYPDSGAGQFKRLPLTGVRDIAFSGDYGVIVRRQPSIPGGFPPQGAAYFTDPFIVFEIGTNKFVPKPVSWLGTSNTFSEDTPYPEMAKLRRVKLNGKWAICTTDSESVASDSYILAVDLSNPARPYYNPGLYQKEFTGRHIDFDIQNEIAYCLSVKEVNGTQHSFLTKYDIYDPTRLQSSVVTEFNMTQGYAIPTTLKDVGGIKVVGRKIFTVHGRRFFIHNSGKLTSSTLAIISEENLPQGYYGTDIDVVGNYAYIYATNETTEESCLIIYDISVSDKPVLLAPITEFGLGIGKSMGSKFAISGNRMYTISAQDSSNNNNFGGINSIKIGGINSPSANIAKLRVSDLDVSENISISNDLDVGNSISVGTGGISIKQGSGITSAAPIISKPTLVNPDTFPYVAGFQTNIKDITFPGAFIGRLAGNDIILQNVDTQNLSFNQVEFPKTIALNIDLRNITTHDYGNTAGSFAYGVYQKHDTDTNTNGTQVINHFQGMVRNVDNNQQENGFYWFGTDTNCASGYDSTMQNNASNGYTPDKHIGQWGIEYLGSSSETDPNENGLNFWKPFPSYNSGNFKLFITDGGRIGINTGTPQYTLDVNGDINASGTITGTFSSANTVITGGSITGNTPISVSSPITSSSAITGNIIIGNTINANNLLSVAGASPVMTLSNSNSSGSGNGAKRQHLIRSFYDNTGNSVETNQNNGTSPNFNEVTTIKTGTQTAAIATNGYVKAKGYFAFSDKRLKNELVDLTKSDKNILDIVNKLRPVIYDWKESGLIEIGFFAQDIEEVLPDLVVSSESEKYKDQKSLHYQSIIALNTAAIQSLSKENKELKTENQELKARLAAIEEKIGL